MHVRNVVLCSCQGPSTSFIGGWSFAVDQLTHIDQSYVHNIIVMHVGLQ